jgi:hypothetical protein
MPGDLQRVMQLQSYSVPFTYTTSQFGQTQSNGPGALNVSITVWGFLNQPPPGAGSNSQVMAIEVSYSLDAGTLYDHQDEGTGFVNMNFTDTFWPAGLGVHSAFSLIGVVPSAGQNTWNQSVSTTLNYKAQTKNYGTWVYTFTVNDTVNGWSVRPYQVNGRPGAMWFLNTPVDGSNLANTWQDAFGGFFQGYRVKYDQFPAAALQALAVKAAWLWTTNNTLLSGMQNPWNGPDWFGTWFDAEGCAIGPCTHLYYFNYEYWRNNFDLYIDFTSLQPVP